MLPLHFSNLCLYLFSSRIRASGRKAAAHATDSEDEEDSNESDEEDDDEETNSSDEEDVSTKTPAAGNNRRAAAAMNGVASISADQPLLNSIPVQFNAVQPNFYQVLHPSS